MIAPRWPSGLGPEMWSATLPLGDRHADHVHRRRHEHIGHVRFAVEADDVVHRVARQDFMPQHQLHCQLKHDRGLFGMAVGDLGELFDEPVAGVTPISRSARWSKVCVGDKVPAVRWDESTHGALVEVPGGPRYPGLHVDVLQPVAGWNRPQPASSAFTARYAAIAVAPLASTRPVAVPVPVAEPPYTCRPAVGGCRRRRKCRCSTVAGHLSSPPIGAPGLATGLVVLGDQGPIANLRCLPPVCFVR